jgi:hypothetical protein
MSAQEIEQYRLRQLDAGALLAVDDHLAQCAACRALVSPPASVVQGVKQAIPSTHLDDAQLEAYAEGRLSDSHPAREHLKACARCCEEAEDLRAFALQRRAKRARDSWRGRIPLAGLAAVACVLAVILFLQIKPRAGAQRSARAIAPSTAAALPADLAQLKREALASGFVAPPPAIAALSGQRGALLGPGVEGPLKLESPIATAVVTLRPEFRWAPVEAAGWYEVSVFDANFEPVVSSGKLHESHWTPARDLPAGKEFLWQLEVSVNSRRNSAPKPPEPEARFATLAAADAARLADFAARYGADHILMGALYARAGALLDARREWRAAISDGHPEAGILLK